VASQPVKRSGAKLELSEQTLGKIEDFLEVIPSKYTRKNYKNGIKKFEKWYGSSITRLIKSPDATRKIEKFFVAMKQKHPQNTCRNVTNAPIQFLKYFGTDVRPRRDLGLNSYGLSEEIYNLYLSALSSIEFSTEPQRFFSLLKNVMKSSVSISKDINISIDTKAFDTR
jgi:hypothetical protein